MASAQAPVIKSASVDKEDTLQYDLINLVAHDANPIDGRAYGTNPQKYLASLARDNTQLLVNQIFSLDSEFDATVQGRLAVLASDSTLTIPREKPVPRPKEPTKWEQFAKEKGILNKKRTRLVLDEQSGEYKARFGHDRANDESKQWVFEAKPGEDPTIDPWTRMANEKKERVSKNKKQKLNNLKAAAGQRVPGTIDLTTTVTAAKPGKRNQASNKAGGSKKGKTHVDAALGLVQQSTASMGRFDSQRSLEPERKLARAPRRDAELQFSVSEEKKQSLSVLNRILGRATESEKFNVDKAANQAVAAKQRKASSGGASAGSSKGGSRKGGKGGSSKGSGKGGKGKGGKR